MEPSEGRRSMKLDARPGSTIYEAYRDLFNFHRTYGKPELEDAYWETLATEASKVAGKYKGTRMERAVNGCLAAILKALDEEAAEEVKQISKVVDAVKEVKG